MKQQKDSFGYTRPASYHNVCVLACLTPLSLLLMSIYLPKLLADIVAQHT